MQNRGTGSYTNVHEPKEAIPALLNPAARAQVLLFQSRPHPDEVITYNAALSACGSCEEWQQAAFRSKFSFSWDAAGTEVLTCSLPLRAGMKGVCDLELWVPSRFAQPSVEARSVLEQHEVILKRVAHFGCAEGLFRRALVLWPRECCNFALIAERVSTSSTETPIPLY